MSNSPKSTRCGPDAQEFVEVSGHAVSVMEGGDLGLAESGNVGVEWVGEWGLGRGSEP
jgi:hypothetical protein